MKNVYLITGLLIIACQSLSAASGIGEREDAPRFYKEIATDGDFKGISFQDAGNITYIVDEATETITVEGYGKAEDLQAHMNGGILTIHREQKRGMGRLELVITAPPTRRIELPGKANITVVDRYAPPQLYILIVGVGNIVFENTVDCDDIDVVIEGKGSVRFNDVTSRYMGTKIEGVGKVIFDGDTRCERHDVEIAGSGTLLHETLACRDLDINVAGIGNIDIGWIDANGVSCDVGGKGDIMLSGTTERTYICLAGVGSCYADEMHSLRTDVEVLGAGKIYCHAAESLRAQVVFPGRVFYAGDPERVSVEGRKSAVRKL